MTKEEQAAEVKDVLLIVGGKMVRPEEKEAPPQEDIFSRHLTPGERQLLQQFSCLRFFSQIDTLVCELGLTAEFFKRAQGALRELATFLSLNDLQIVLFVVLYMNSEDTGSDIPLDTVCESLHLPSQRLLSLIDEREMEGMGLLKSNFQASPAVFRQLCPYKVALYAFASQLHLKSNNLQQALTEIYRTLPLVPEHGIYQLYKQRILSALTDQKEKSKQLI